ncbi:MAG: hypothetical protein EOO23_09285, partial [Comamonadaceae bacterium]
MRHPGYPSHLAQIVVATPAHSNIAGPLSYAEPSDLAAPLAAGTLVRVPLGKREVLGVVWDAEGDGSDGS